ncbi:LamG domain-containing protein, partial [Patescibacteria group bacterium]|nr:LamG domain-containing protein [Patescibacteria group bacterium]
NVSISSGIISATGFSSPSVYVNGIGSSTISADQWSHIAITTATPFDANDIDIGRISTNYFDGTIDNVKIYDKALSTAEISWEYNQGAPIAHWALNEGLGTTAYDESDHDYDSTLGTGNSSPSWVDGKTSKALDFDGTNDYVSLPNSFNLNQGSVTAWVKTTDTTGVIFAEGNSASSDPYFMLTIYPSAAGIYRSSYQGLAYGNTNITDNKWHFITWTQTGSANGLKIYIDGQEETLTWTEGSNNGGWFDDCAGNTFAIGVLDRSSDWGYLDGIIDEVKVYNYVLTTNQIKTNYNNEAIKFN